MKTAFSFVYSYINIGINQQKETKYLKNDKNVIKVYMTFCKPHIIVLFLIQRLRYTSIQYLYFDKSIVYFQRSIIFADEIKNSHKN